jgi:hypothetical protein
MTDGFGRPPVGGLPPVGPVHDGRHAAADATARDLAGAQRQLTVLQWVIPGFASWTVPRGVFLQESTCPLPPLGSDRSADVEKARCRNLR